MEEHVNTRTLNDLSQTVATRASPAYPGPLSGPGYEVTPRAYTTPHNTIVARGSATFYRSVFWFVPFRSSN